jgi:hypothetical protein
LRKISTNPRRGDIYDCLFGNYDPINPAQPNGPFRKDNYDFRIPNEMRKRRPVVVLGDRNKQLLVVPISKLEERLREFRLADGSYVRGTVSPKILLAIQEGVMRHMGLTEWVEEKRTTQNFATETDATSGIEVEEDPVTEPAC